MDDLTAKLQELLGDPESMQRVRQMAESILGEDMEDKKESTPDISTALEANELQGMLSLVSKFNSLGGDSRTQLLNALKPHLSETRREKVDTAIKILKILELLPFIKESGLFKL